MRRQLLLQARLGYVLFLTFCLSGCAGVGQNNEQRAKQVDAESRLLESWSKEKISLSPINERVKREVEAGTYQSEYPDGLFPAFKRYERDRYECNRDVDQTLPGANVLSRYYVLREGDRHRMYMDCMSVRGWRPKK